MINFTMENVMTTDKINIVLNAIDEELNKFADKELPPRIKDLVDSLEEVKDWFEMKKIENHIHLEE